MDISVILKPLDVCTPTCRLGRKTAANKPMVPCAMCDRWHHFECVGFEVGTPSSVRGLYMCPACVEDLRRREQRLAALEDTLATFHAEFVLLRGLWERSVRPTTPSSAILSAAYVTLVQENAELKLRLGERGSADSGAMIEGGHVKGTEVSKRSWRLGFSVADKAKNQTSAGSKSRALNSEGESEHEEARVPQPKSNSQRHRMASNTGPFKCKQCGLRYQSINSVYRHTKRAHRTPLTKNRFECKLCSRHFVLRVNYDKHLEKHARRKEKALTSAGDCYRRQYLTKCRTTSATTTRKSAVALEETARCDICCQVFLQRSAMLEHVQLKHPSAAAMEGQSLSEETENANIGLLIPKTEPVDVLDETNNQDATNGPTLDAPTASTTKDTGSRIIYSCDSCSGTYYSHRKLDFHRFKMHDGPSPFVCKRCAKIFASEKALEYHRNHHEFETFPCSRCNLNYVLRAHLILHNRHGCGTTKILTKPPIPNCQSCGKTFTKMWRRNAHVKVCRSARNKSGNDVIAGAEEVARQSTPNDVQQPDGSLKGSNVNDERRFPNHMVSLSAANTDTSIESDHFLYCSECDDTFLGECLTHPFMRVHDTEVEPNDSCRAYNSLPSGLSIAKSFIVGAGLGVWTDTAIPKGIVFGPYLGIVTCDVADTVKSDYCWQVPQTLVPSFYVDGSDIAHSNWMRFINCADNDEQQNLTAFQYKGHIYYRTIKPVCANKELLVWYGEEYAKVLGLAEKDKDDSDSSDDEKEPSEKTTGATTDHPPAINDDFEAPSSHECSRCSFVTSNPEEYRLHLESHSTRTSPVLKTVDSRPESPVSMRTEYVGNTDAIASDEIPTTRSPSESASSAADSDSTNKRGTDGMSATTESRSKRLRLMPNRLSQDDRSDGDGDEDRDDEDDEDDEAEQTAGSRRSSFSSPVDETAPRLNFSCRICDRRFSKLSHVRLHARLHVLRHRCPSCTMRFDSKDKVAAHIKRDHELSSDSSDDNVFDQSVQEKVWNVAERNTGQDGSGKITIFLTKSSSESGKSYTKSYSSPSSPSEKCEVVVKNRTQSSAAIYSSDDESDSQKHSNKMEEELVAAAARDSSAPCGDKSDSEFDSTGRQKVADLWGPDPVRQGEFAGDDDDHSDCPDRGSDQSVRTGLSPTNSGVDHCHVSLVASSISSSNRNDKMETGQMERDLTPDHTRLSGEMVEMENGIGGAESPIEFSKNELPVRKTVRPSEETTEVAEAGTLVSVSGHRGDCEKTVVGLEFSTETGTA